jgi:hypothetical protein
LPTAPANRQLVEQLRQLQGAAAVPQDNQADQQANVADARGDERFLGGHPRRQQVHAALGGALVPEADQQIAAQTDELPADEQEQQVVGQDDCQHAEGEQRQVGKEAAIPGVALAVLDHVRARVHLDQEADSRDDDQHDRRQRVDLNAQAQELFCSALRRWGRQQA